MRSKRCCEYWPSVLGQISLIKVFALGKLLVSISIDVR